MKYTAFGTRFRTLFVFTTVAAALAGCSKQASQSNQNLPQPMVTAGNPSVDQTVSSGGRSYRLMAHGQVDALTAQNKLAAPDSVEATSLLEKFTSKTGGTTARKQSATQTKITAEAADTSLVVGIPLDGIGEQWVFDGVIVGVSDKNNTDLGDLKLTDLNPIHIQLELVKSKEGSYFLLMMGCVSKCTESSSQEAIQDLPVVAVDTKNNMVMVDLAAVGKDLDLVGMMDSDGSATHLKTVSTNTVAATYDENSLIFDVESHMKPFTVTNKVATITDSAPETVFTTRWFMRLSSAFNPAFESREPTPGVGFFETNRAADTKITRWSTTSPDGVAPVHYFVKNIPDEFKPAFQSAFDEWNAKLKPVLGKEIFSYEFVDQNDPRNAQLVAGDPRFNIVEWDLVNKASYGGLGPSIANQFTGENITANVYIQGPTIVQLYTTGSKSTPRLKRFAIRARTKPLTCS